MKMFSVALMGALMVATGSAQGPPCDTPLQLEYSFWELDPNGREYHNRPSAFEAEGYQIYDGFSERRFTREDRIRFDGSQQNEDRFEYFEDFRERYIYARSQTNRNCQVFQMDPRREWADHWVGVAPNSTFVGKANIGAYPIEVPEFIFYNNQSWHNGCIGFEVQHQTVRECIPIVRHFYCDQTGFELKDYHNTVIGISDPDGHINPYSRDWSDCKRQHEAGNVLPFDHHEATRAKRKAALTHGQKNASPPMELRGNAGKKKSQRRKLQNGPPCRSPDQLEYRFWEIDPNKRTFHGRPSDFMARGWEVYDRSEMRRYRREDVIIDFEGSEKPEEDKFEYLDDYYRRQTFVHVKGQSGCKVYKMDGNQMFPYIGPDSSAVFREKQTIGAYPIELSQWAFSNNKTEHMGCEGFTWETYTEHECVPTFRHFYCKERGFELRDYYDVVIGISDPMGPINPHSDHWADCRH